MECGATITVTKQSKKEYTYNHNENINKNINKNINVDKKQTYRKIDDARIREADVQETIRLRELEIELLKMRDESRQKKFSLYTKIGVLAAFVLLLVVLVILMITEKTRYGEPNYACFLLAVIVVVAMAIIIPKLFKNKQ